MGILGPDGAPLNSSPLNYGLPNVTLSNDLTGLSEQQPSFSLSQTISFSETLSWIHGKHNLRFGGDYRRVHRDFLGGSMPPASFTFTGLFTERRDADAAPRTGHRLIACRFSARPAAKHHHRFIGGQELSARQRVRRLCTGRLARAALPHAELRRALRVFCALHGEIRPPGGCGHESAQRSPAPK
jgi:hypothetical protein